MKDAIHALKYDRLHPAARGLGRMLAEAIAQLAPEAPAKMLVVPVPLHRAKQSARGFNQARSLAVHALAFLGKSHPEWRLMLASSTLMRLRETGSQAGLTPRQRRLNVRGAFSVNDPSEVKARHILLIDDIFTTGATARSAAQALVRAGAASVWVATLARAQRVYTPQLRTPQLREPHRRSAFESAEDDFTSDGNVAAATAQPESIHSSQDQPSF
jgi:ComF family protein